MDYIYDFKVREEGDKRPWNAIPASETVLLDPSAEDFFERIDAVVTAISAQKEVQDIQYSRRGFCQVYFAK